MKLLGIACFFLAALCVCAVGDDVVPTSTITTSVSALTSKSVTEAVNPSTPQAATPQASVLTTIAIRATDEPTTSKSTATSPNPTQQITQGTTTQPPVKATATAASKNDSTTTSLHVSSPTEPMTLGSPASNSGNKNVPENAIHYSKRQENGTEHPFAEAHLEQYWRKEFEESETEKDPLEDMYKRPLSLAAASVFCMAKSNTWAADLLASPDSLDI
ncbi:Emcn [Columba guinea]|nr:Emcn [Columba guinea]